MKVVENVRDERKGLVVEGGDVEGLHELGINLVDLRADDRGQEVVVPAVIHAYMVVGDHCIFDFNVRDIQVQFPVRINGHVSKS